MTPHRSKLTALALSALLLSSSAIGAALACTRTLYVGADNVVITGRNMDWQEDMFSNLWIFPAGMKRNGATGPKSIEWTSKHGSVVVSGYEVGSTDGMNEKGLVANMLYLAESNYGKPVESRPNLSVAAWPQFVLDNYATVSEAVEALRKEPFNLLAPTLPNGSPAALHLAISDSSGDSAIFEYVGGKLVIHHGKQYAVMTNSPVYDQQLALDEYWKGIGGTTFLPGTARAADRFVRASFLLGAIPRKIDKNFIKSVPEQSFAYQAVASVMSVQRAVSVPLGLTTPNEPNISSTLWRTVSDQKNLVYYFDSATRPNTFWVSLAKLNLKPGAPVRKLTIQNGEVFSGEVAGAFKDAEPFKFLPATPQ
ncbi:MAG: linear amide C-N hydrolase [Reyranella sp.]|uniref:linear amide C-N hydrolase n=1 Tax=Reyranella sp. TaxID=1929291 RepID=UPI0011F51770|nr:linear amide C-N hydrolase [Reyranella sp.]TAJ43009.1 MAG: linear amide C-N hydrolase [Reyranella sp.]